MNDPYEWYKDDEVVRIIKTFPRGQVLITPARFITPEELMDEFVVSGRIGGTKDDAQGRPAHRTPALGDPRP
jgi:hypothetical protein